MQTSWRALWRSDIHLGTSAARIADLLRFLDSVSADVIYLAGDIVDVKNLKSRPTFPRSIARSSHVFSTWREAGRG